MQAQIFDAAGSKIGTEFLVNTQTFSTQALSNIARLTNGGFVIAWQDGSGTLGDSSGDSIKAQFFDVTGAKIGSEFLVNTTTLGSQQTPDIAALTGGGFVVSWYDGSTGEIRAQRFDASGAMAGTEFLVNTQTMGSQSDPSITGQADGGFIISWTDFANISDANVKAQAFDATGAKVGMEFILSTATSLNQVHPSVGGLPDGGFVAVWTDHSFTLGDTSTSSIKAQAYQLQPTGTPGDDSFVAPLGSKRFDAGGGIDTVTFGFKLVDATVTWSGNQVIVDSASSHTILTGFEKYVFTDGTVNNNDGDALVDDLFYYSQNHDVWNAHADADQHYHQYGWHEGRDPSAFFDTSFYLSVYQDVRASGADPLTQFGQTGWLQGRVPSLNFDPAKYLAANPDVAAAHLDPLAHFLHDGAQEGRQPFAVTELLASNGFDYVYYLQHNPDVAAAGIDPLQHFETMGWKEGRNPNALFDTAGYLFTYGDVKAAGVNPLDHYHTDGWHEGRDPSKNFDTSDYIAHYPDVAAAHLDPLKHFLENGVHESRSAFADGAWG